MRSSAKLTLFFFAATATVLGCALSFGPGDYTGAGSDASDNDAVPAPPPDGGSDTTAPDGDPSDAPTRRLLVLAGEKDGPDTPTNDVWVAPIEANGDVGQFEYIQPGLFRGTLVTANVAGGRLFVASRANGRSVEHVAVDAGLLVPPWHGQTVAAPELPGYGQIFSGSSLLALGGAGDVPDDTGATVFVRDDAIRISAFDGGAFGALTPSTSKLPVPLRDMTTVAYKDFVYVIGGDGAAADQKSKVYVGRTDPQAGVGAFTETSRVINPQNNQPHTPSSPIVCAGEGRLFMAGGMTGSSATDIVLAATIDEGDGTIGPWKAVTKLPGPLRGAGCAIWNGHLHVLGGIGATSRSDRIVRAPIAQDGTLGEWELSSGEKLPAPRSSVIAIPF